MAEFENSFKGNEWMCTLFTEAAELSEFLFIHKKIKIKTGYSLIDFDEIFLIQLEEFTKSLNFGSDWKKNAIF